jgi:hypothetical protein
MISLMRISAIGLILSAVIHICSIFHIFDAPRELIVLIHVGGVAVVYFAFIISKKVCSENNVTDFKNAMRSGCPQWMAIMTGLLVIYALAGLLFFLFRRYFVGSASINGFTGHWMALYALAFTMLYSCMRLKNNRH